MRRGLVVGIVTVVIVAIGAVWAFGHPRPGAAEGSDQWWCFAFDDSPSTAFALGGTPAIDHFVEFPPDGPATLFKCVHTDPYGGFVDVQYMDDPQPDANYCLSVEKWSELVDGYAAEGIFLEPPGTELTDTCINDRETYLSFLNGEIQSVRQVPNG
jgi:hypothetical protein